MRKTGEERQREGKVGGSNEYGIIWNEDNESRILTKEKRNGECNGEKKDSKVMEVNFPLKTNKWLNHVHDELLSHFMI